MTFVAKTESVSVWLCLAAVQHKLWNRCLEVRNLRTTLLIGFAPTSCDHTVCLAHVWRAGCVSASRLTCRMCVRLMSDVQEVCLTHV